MPLCNIASNRISIAITGESIAQIRMTIIKLTVDDRDRDALSPVSTRPTGRIGVDETKGI